LALNSLFRLNLSQQDIVRVVHQANTSFNNETCRIGDLMTLLNGLENKVVFFDHQHSTYQFVDFPFTEDISEYKTVIIDSKIPAQAMRDENIFAHKFTQGAMDKLHVFYKDTTRRDIPEKDIVSRIIPIEEKYRNICVFTLRESRFAQEAKNLLEQNQPVLYGRVMNRAQVDLRDKLEITCPEVDWLVKRASEIEGCKGAHLVFDGNSGSIMLLISNESLALYREKMEDYGHIFGFDATCKDFVPTKSSEVLFSK
jgi:galactokinase